MSGVQPQVPAPLMAGQTEPVAIKIDSNIPLPPLQPGATGKRWGYAQAFRQMAVGQSLVYRGRGTDIYTARKNAPKVARFACPSAQFAARLVVEDGERVVRVWRTK